MKTGPQGERIAERYLVGCGYSLLEKNRRFRFGELDLVALDGRTLVFVEVKTRTATNPDRPEMRTPEDNLTPLKKLVLRRAATHYANRLERKTGHAYDVRVDVIAIVLYKDRAVVRHYKNAL